jgi:hypothetical protein
MSEVDGVLRRFRQDFTYYAPRALKIKTKSGEIKPFNLNDAQQYAHNRLESQLSETGKIRALVLKGRQQGVSTYIQGRFYWRTSTRSGKRAFILTHELAATKNLFDMAQRFHKHCPSVLRPHTQYSNANELYFDRTDSGYSVATAGSRDTGRSATAQLMHGCLSPDTIVVTPSGSPRRMGDFAVGDSVRTHTGKIASIAFISSKKASVKVVRLQGSSAPVVATAEHKFWTPNGMLELGSLSVGDTIGYPVETIASQDVSWPYRLDYGRVAGRGGAGSVGPDTLHATRELGLVLGLYLAEGSVIRQSKAPCRPAAVQFTVHEREVKRTLDWLSALGPCWRSPPSIEIRPGTKAVKVIVYSRSFAEFVLARCGELDEKAMPREWRLNEEFARGLVIGYFSGDGGGESTRFTRVVRAPSTRGAISFGMRDALASLGYGWASISYRDGAVRNGRNEKPQWTVSVYSSGADRLFTEMGRECHPRQRNQPVKMQISGGYAWLPILSIEDGGEREVMDFEVDHPDHSYCIWQCASSNSERAFWPNAADHLAGIGQTVPDSDGTEVIHETTANGIANEFYGAWQEAVKGRGQYRAIFIPWFWQREYRVSLDRYRSITGSDLDLSSKDEQYQKTFGLDLEQMAWRSFKIIDDFKGDKSLFDQEYPASPELAFTRSSGRACIDVGLVVVARKTVLPPSGVRVMGVDPAEYGDDDTHFSMREGRCISREHRETGKLDVMQVAGIAKVKALEWKAQVVNVDATGIGAGVWARLKELIEPLGIPVNRVMLGEGAHDKTRFRNRRNELAWAMKEWFEEGPVQIPDDDAYCAELTAPEYDYEGSNRMFRLESKEHMRLVRKIPSPDAFDSTMLTFASTSVPGREDDRDETPAGSWRVG